MTNKYSVARIFRDGETRLVIPNLEITAMNAVTKNTQGTVEQGTPFGQFINRILPGIYRAVLVTNPSVITASKSTTSDIAPLLISIPLIVSSVAPVI